MAEFNSGNYSSGDNTATDRRSSINYTYYSPIRINHKEGQMGFNFEYRGALLIFRLFARDINNNWKKEPEGEIFISPTKAGLLANEIRNMIKYIEEGDIDGQKAFGISGGMNEKISFIAFNPLPGGDINIVIGKFDGNGQIVERHECPLNREYHYSLQWANLDAMEVDKVYNDNVEILQIMHMLDDFARYMNGAAAYANAYVARYDTARILNKLDPIFDKLGIERLTGSNYRERGTNNFLANMEAKASESKFTLEDLDV